MKDTIEGCGGKVLNGVRYRADWMGSSYQFYRLQTDRNDNDYWYGIGSTPAGREWSDKEIEKEVKTYYAN